MKKTILDDGYQSYLVEGDVFVGESGIPMMMDLKNTKIKDQFIYHNPGVSDDKRDIIAFPVTHKIGVDLDEIGCLKISISDDPFIHRFYDQFR